MNFVMTMTYGTFMKYQIVAIVSGAMMAGTWILCKQWERDYDAARRGGAVK